MQLLDQSLSAIATSIAGATAVFHKYKLDFCCGGALSLREAVKQRELPEGEIVEVLSTLQQKPAGGTDWRKASVPVLIEHILERFHARHRQQVPELIRLARRVEHVHGDKADCPIGLAHHLEMMGRDLENHLMKEEQILFPILKRGIYPAAPISVMESEHQQHGESLERLDALTHDITLPAGACNTWTALYLGLREFKEDLMEHILLENGILFVQPDQV